MVPVKDLGRAKSRLSSVLGAEQRREVALAMFRGVGAAIAGSDCVAGWVVVTRDVVVAAEARGYRAVVVEEEGGGLNEAVVQGCREASNRGADAVLIIPSDLPLLGPRDIEAVVTLGSMLKRGVVVVPCRRGDGTNALYMKPPGVIVPSFGPGSYARHLAGARARGISVVCHCSPALGMDVDTPEDLWVAGLGRATREGRRGS